MIALEFASGDGREERDATPLGTVQIDQRLKPGKFWVYEQAIRIPFYGIFIIRTGDLEVYRLLDGRYQRMEPNAAGRFPIPPLAVELGVWQGRYQNLTQPWLRWWSAAGKLLPTGGNGLTDWRRSCGSWGSIRMRCRQLVGPTRLEPQPPKTG